MAGQNEWNESLFGCFDDIKTCLCGWCCLPCLFGKNVEKIDNSSCFLWCCAYGCLSPFYLCCIPHYFKRQELRERFRLQEDPDCSDILATICCGPCAVCQEARFLKRQGGQQREIMNMNTQTIQPGRRS